MRHGTLRGTRWCAAFLLLGLTGCPVTPDVLGFSTTDLDFGTAENQRSVSIWNTSPDHPDMRVTVTVSEPWIDLTLGDKTIEAITLPAPVQEGQPGENVVMDVRINRQRLAGAAHEAIITFSAPKIVPKTIRVRVAPPYDAITVSTPSLDFGTATEQLSVRVGNNNPEAGPLTITAVPSASWLHVAPSAVVSQSPALTPVVQDEKTLTVSVDRNHMSAGAQQAQIELQAPGYIAKTILVSAFRTYNAIGVSSEQLIIDYNELPQTLEVWNTNPALPSVALHLSTSVPWILLDPVQLSSEAPQGGQYDRRTVTVQIDRTQLSAGTHEGTIAISGLNITPKNIYVRVKQAHSSQLEDLNIIHPVVQYHSPYLVEFHFALTDQDGHAVIAEPTQFVVTALEGDAPVGSETGVHLRPDAARQLKIDLVLDYTLSMQLDETIIPAMEQAAVGVFLPALSEDALVGVMEFHREDRDARRAAAFSPDHAYISDRIQSIQEEYVMGYSGASKAWEAMNDSVQSFDLENAADEARYIVLFSDGRDTSSVGAGVDDVVTEALLRQVHVFAIGFGDHPNTQDLTYLANATGGEYFPAVSYSQLVGTFADIVENLGGRYLLRWASLTRNDALAFLPSFSIETGNASATFAATQPFVPSQHAGDVLQGRLKLLAAPAGNGATALLRAEYAPRFIGQISLYAESLEPFTVELSPAAEDGLVEGWAINMVPDTVQGGTWINLVSNGNPIPFATVGPLCRFHFAQAPASGPLFTHMEVNNALYPNGQSFVIEGDAAALP